MHGLVNRAIQCFVRDTCGVDAWESLARAIDVGPEGFEAMLTYDDSLTEALLAEATTQLDKPEEMLLEDLGTYLVSHPNTEAIRRLLRFGGETFVEFLLSLDDLPDRARLAVPDLDLPTLEVSGGEDGQYVLEMRGGFPGFHHVLIGVLRAMADDYGALVLLDEHGAEEEGPQLRISLLDSAFAEGRSFTLARPSPTGTGANG